MVTNQTRYHQKYLKITRQFGFHAIKGQITIDFKDHFKKEDIIEFLKLIRVISPFRRIMIILGQLPITPHKPNHPNSSKTQHRPRIPTTILTQT